MKYALILFMLFESLYVLTLSTDPIHREDWKSATRWMMEQDANIERAIDPQFSYYGGLIENRPDPNWILIMDGYSMMAQNNQTNEAYFTTKLLERGFYKERMVRFGGKNGHTVVFVFRRING